MAWWPTCSRRSRRSGGEGEGLAVSGARAGGARGPPDPHPHPVPAGGRAGQRLCHRGPGRRAPARRRRLRLGEATAALAAGFARAGPAASRTSGGSSSPMVTWTTTAACASSRSRPGARCPCSPTPPTSPRWPRAAGAGRTWPRLFAAHLRRLGVPPEALAAIGAEGQRGLQARRIRGGPAPRAGRAPRDPAPRARGAAHAGAHARPPVPSRPGTPAARLQRPPPGARLAQPAHRAGPRRLGRLVPAAGRVHGLAGTHPGAGGRPRPPRARAALRPPPGGDRHAPHLLRPPPGAALGRSSRPVHGRPGSSRAPSSASSGPATASW